MNCHWISIWRIWKIKIQMHKNALTIDVEDFYHVSAFSHKVSRSDWGRFESRVVNNTRRILTLLSKRNVKGTFFVLGWVAEKHPELVQEIDSNGHEVASHGYSHQLIYKQGKKEFYDETKFSKELLEDLIGKPVNGYRAASYSITPRSLWALEILHELGFSYDSSIFPVFHDRYGIPHSPKQPYKIKFQNGGFLKEFPLSTTRFIGLTLPIAGGGYFRLYPYFLTERLINRHIKHNHPYVFYIHPWEIDPGQPRIDAGFLSRFRHYTNLDICMSRFERLIEKIEFTTMDEVLSHCGNLQDVSASDLER